MKEPKEVRKIYTLSKICALLLEGWFFLFISNRLLLTYLAYYTQIKLPDWYMTLSIIIYTAVLPVIITIAILSNYIYSHARIMGYDVFTASRLSHGITKCIKEDIKYARKVLKENRKKKYEK